MKFLDLVEFVYYVKGFGFYFERCRILFLIIRFSKGLVKNFCSYVGCLKVNILNY